MNDSPATETIHGHVLAALSRGEVRVITVGDQTWFPVNDIVTALGVSRRTLDYHVGHLPEADRRHIPRPLRPSPETSFGHAGLTCVSVVGLFKLMLRTNGEAATAFQDWLCREVLLRLWDSGLRGHPQKPAR